MSMEKDWEFSHRTEQMAAVMGKDMSMSDFWLSGEDRFTNMTSLFLGEKDISMFTCLDIGCGPGRILKPMAERMRRAIGIDISSTAVKSAKENLKNLSNVEIYKVDGKEFSNIENRSIDLVTCYDVFQHIPSLSHQKIYLREVSRVLKEDGTYVIQIKSDAGWLRLFGIPIMPRHFRWFIPKVLFNLALVNKRAHRKLSTWRGNLFRHNDIGVIFNSCGLSVSNVVYDGRETRWVISGTLAPEKN